MFSNRLIELRLQKGLTIKEVAQALGVPYTTYNSYEKNTREPNSESLIKISDFFNVSIDYLLGRTTVKTRDKKVKTVNDVTGLSERAIEHLCFMKQFASDENSVKEKSTPTSLDILNDFIENPYFSNLIAEIRCYGQAKRKYYKDPTKFRRWDWDFDDMPEPLLDASQLIHDNNLYIVDTETYIQLTESKIQQYFKIIEENIIYKLFTKDVEENYYAYLNKKHEANS